MCNNLLTETAESIPASEMPDTQASDVPAAAAASSVLAAPPPAAAPTGVYLLGLCWTCT